MKSLSKIRVQALNAELEDVKKTSDTRAQEIDRLNGQLVQSQTEHRTELHHLSGRIDQLNDQIQAPRMYADMRHDFQSINIHAQVQWFCGLVSAITCSNQTDGLNELQAVVPIPENQIIGGSLCIMLPVDRYTEIIAAIRGRGAAHARRTRHYYLYAVQRQTIAIHAHTVDGPRNGTIFLDTHSFNGYQPINYAAQTNRIAVNAQLIYTVVEIRHQHIFLHIWYQLKPFRKED